MTISVNDEGFSRITLCALHLELLTLPEHLSTPPVFSGVCVTQTLVLYVCFIDRCLSFVLFVLAIVLSDLLRCADYDYLPLVSSHSSSYLRFIALTNLIQMFVPSEKKLVIMYLCVKGNDFASFSFTILLVDSGTAQTVPFVLLLYPISKLIK